MDRAQISTTVLNNGVGERIDLIYPKQSPTDEPEEIVLSVQGFVIQSNLPPILSSVQWASDHSIRSIFWSDSTYDVKD